MSRMTPPPLSLSLVSLILALSYCFQRFYVPSVVVELLLIPWALCFSPISFSLLFLPPTTLLFVHLMPLCPCPRAPWVGGRGQRQKAGSAAPALGTQACSWQVKRSLSFMTIRRALWSRRRLWEMWRCSSRQKLDFSLWVLHLLVKTLNVVCRGRLCVVCTRINQHNVTKIQSYTNPP